MTASTPKEQRSGKIQTVLGLVDPATLGPTLMHEHLLIDLNPPETKVTQESECEITLCNCWQINFGQQLSTRNYRLDNIEIVTEEVNEMREAGGGAIVELTVGGLKPNPSGLVEIAQSTGVPIVMGCGYYVEQYQAKRNHERSVEDFASEMIQQLTEGAWGTSVKAGIIGEIGCQNPWTDLEKKVMRGALAAQKETGASISVHPGRKPTQPREVVDFIKAAGGDVSRLIIGHIDRTIFDDATLLDLADTGVTLEFDMFGWEHTAYPVQDVDIPNDGARIRMLRALADHGHIDRIVISHDICVQTRLRRFGGHGYQHIFANVVPRMLRRGFMQEEIDAILVRNPRRLLTLK
jgi:phosphotriesterase-related protein